MTADLIFVTAPEADYKSINLLLLLLRDWPYADGEDDWFRLVTTKNAYDIDVPSTERRATSPQLDSSLDNAWAGATIDDVEGFCLDIEHSAERSNDDDPGLDASLFILLDSHGLEARECVIGQRAFSYNEETRKCVYEDKFKKMRVPWDDVFITWCNLDVSNSDWEDFTEEDDEKGVDSQSSPDECWYIYRSQPDDFTDSARKKRDEEIRRMQEAGWI